MNRKLGKELFEAAKDGLTEKLTLLVGVATAEEVNYANPERWTALMHASRWGRDEIVNILLSAGAGLDFQNKYGRTALIWAADENRITTVKILLQASADTDVCDNHGWTALMRAASRGHLEVVQLLVQAGADINKRDRATNATAFELAVRYKHSDSVLYLQGMIDV